MRHARAAARAGAVPARTLRGAGAGRDLPPGPRVHGGDPRQRCGGVLSAGHRVRFLGVAPGRAAGFGYDELIQEVVRIAWRRLTGEDIAAETAGARQGRSLQAAGTTA